MVESIPRFLLRSFLCLSFLWTSVSCVDWSSVDAVLTDAISRDVFPGCAAAVIDSAGKTVYMSAFGHYTYGIPTPVGHDNPLVSVADTLWDMASISKILGGTTACAVLYEGGYLDLGMAVSDPSLLGPSYAVNGKGSVTVADCLLHQAGYPPDPSPSYDSVAFGCPATSSPSPPLDFSCSELIFAALLAQPLAYPPGTAWTYSDLSLITIQYVVGTIVAREGLVATSDLRPDCASADPVQQPGLYKTCHFEAFVRVAIHGPIGMVNTAYLPPSSSAAAAMPTWNESGYYRNLVIQGTVSDDNAYALGGIAGHAGIFSTISDMAAFAATWAGYSGSSRSSRSGSSGGAQEGSLQKQTSLGRKANGPLINDTTRNYFRTAPNPAFSPRALGWVVQVPTDTYQGCGGNFSSLTAYHTGYTGTLICLDPTTNISTVLLTNRVYPNSTGQMDTIHAVRQEFDNAVMAVINSR